MPRVPEGARGRVSGYCMSQNSSQTFMGWSFAAFNIEIWRLFVLDNA